MPVTAKGTAYTVHEATTPAHGTVVWAVADNKAGSADIPTVLYAHGSGGAYNQFATLSAWSGLRDWLIDNGWAWIEGTGGTPTDGAESWGNQNARDAYTTYVNHVTPLLDIGGIVVLGRSMGGLVSYWLYTQSTFASRCVGMIINSGVTDLAAAGLSFTPKIWYAYGATGSASFTANSVGYDPMDYPLELWDGKNVLQLGGDSDPTVPFNVHGLAIRAQWSGRPSIDSVYTRPGGDHSAGNGSYLDVPQMTAFLQDVTGTAAPAGPGRVYVTAGHYIIRGGELYEVAPHFPS